MTGKLAGFHQTIEPALWVPTGSAYKISCQSVQLLLKNWQKRFAQKEVQKGKIFESFLELPEHLSREVGANCSPLTYFLLVFALLARKPSC